MDRLKEKEDAKAQEFLKELKTLLAKYNATLSCEDHFMGYPECGEDVRMTVSMDAVYDDEDLLCNYVELDLGKYVSP